MPRTDPTPAIPADARPDEDAADRALVRAILAGRGDAWNDLVRRYQDRVFSLCLRMVNNDRDLAADLSQDAFLRIIRGLGSFDDRARLSTWVYRVTINSCLSRLRQEKLRRHPSLDSPQSTNDVLPASSRRQTREPPPGSRVQTVDERERLLGALGVLSDEHRAILILRDSRGLEYEQIAETLDIPVGTVRSRLFRARAALRNELESPRGGKEQT
ncbi:MAG TPA: sigma-70 family RNA polymerase sigma factor [Phycisphaerales bacterium]|nr:sigma-70 family RNA polymerase sigma factor [Phycisphaerales bacterium]